MRENKYPTLVKRKNEWKITTVCLGKLLKRILIIGENQICRNQVNLLSYSMTKENSTIQRSINHCKKKDSVDLYVRY